MNSGTGNNSTNFLNNKSLFSDHYLDGRLENHKVWNQDIQEIFENTAELYQNVKDRLPKFNEAQTEEHFIKPVLKDILGFSFDVQHSVKQKGRINRPDYTLFANEENLKIAQEHREDNSRFLGNAIAVADAKYWERSLDGRGDPDKDPELSNANPSFQIVNYLTATGKDWGILTNGRHWRLYYAKARSRVDSYFEVDLKEILENGDTESFRYFFHFFRSSAFQTDPDTGKSFVEAVYEGSIDYGVQLEKRLKELIFDKIFLKLARGFVEYRKNELDIQEETEESLGEIYQGTLRLLYRLLFLLHAESRGLLPVNDEKGYYQRSLQKLKRDFAESVDNEIVPSEVSDDEWNDLAALFRIIDKGDKRLNVPRYNGGLFRNDNPSNQFLNEHKIADYYLVPALELLTRESDPITGQKRFIDYKSLNVEQLGSIYEGLLEFHLRIAGEPLAVVKEKGREVYKPKKKVKDPSVMLEKGELYLENDKGERKATGSYYTPHYIVEHIVEHTLGPVFEERAATFRELMEQLEPKYPEFEKLDRKIRNGDDSTKSHNKRKALHLEIESLERKATEALLSIKVCDPAMGSGHFLKEATDKLAEKIITLLAEFPKNPVTKLLEEIRTQILESLEKQEITIEAEEHLKDTNLIKRMVMKRSIYGVDLNPMAVELAKLSLWLDSFTVGAPLSFLDHHLKTGNSLIGTTVKDVKFTLELDEDSQIDIFGGPFAGLLTATELMRNVALKTDATIGEIEESIEQFSEYEKAVLPYKKLLDLWLSQHFDNDKAIMLLRQYPEKVIAKYKGQKTDLKKQYEPILEEAEKLAFKEEFFHWELEFPEVFIDLRRTKWLDNPGFDVVIGNPPYVRMEQFKDLKDYLRENYKVYAERTDLYGYFIEKGLSLVSEKRQLGFIVSNKWMRANYGKPIRLLIEETASARYLIDFGDLRVFDATTYPLILIVTKERNVSLDGISAKIPNLDFKDLHRMIEKISVPFSQNQLKEMGWGLLGDSGFNVLTKMQKNSVSLIDYIDSPPLMGIKSGLNEAFVINQEQKNELVSRDEKSEDLIFPVRIGKDIRRYSLNNPNTYLIYTTRETNIDDYPVIKEHLNNFRKKLESRAAIEKWYELQQPQKAYKKKFLSTKIIYPDITEDMRFYLDESGNLLRTTANFLPTNDRYLLAILNSKVTDFFLTSNSVKYRGDYLRLKAQYVQEIPIRKIDFSKFNPDKNAEYPERLENLYQDYLNDASVSEELLDLTEHVIEDEKEYRLPLIHDFLADLAERMLEYHKEKQKLQSALDPFKFLNKGVAFKPFSEVFTEAIKYGELLSDSMDIGKVHHDIEGLRLEPTGDYWLLSLLLKHRDSETDWDDWEKDEDGNIVRSTQPMYQFDLTDEQGRYWQQSFEVLDQFENSSNFPGGKTRTTHEKLMESDVPVFDEKANIEPLIELREELAEVETKIEKTDWLIDQVVYRLYGLNEEEILVVEGSAG